MSFQIIDEKRSVQKEIEDKKKRLFTPNPNSLASRTTAALYRCPDCQVWWGSNQQNALNDPHVFRTAEPDSDMFRWDDYRGWRGAAEANVCPECGQHVDGPAYSLR